MYVKKRNNKQESEEDIASVEKVKISRKGRKLYEIDYE